MTVAPLSAIELVSVSMNFTRPGTMPRPVLAL
jgi:hypothetical protein